MDFYRERISRLFCDDTGGVVRDPEPGPPAKIPVDEARRKPGPVKISEAGDKVTVSTLAIVVEPTNVRAS